MIKKPTFLSVAFIGLSALMLLMTLGAPSPAQAKDSFYYMKDDGEFSAEEKDEEAQYVYGVCQSNVFQSTYFDCACIAGAFRIERDKEDLVPQNSLLNSLYSDKQKSCINKVAIAGDAYQFCQQYAQTYRNRNSNNEPYCECVANKVANDFEREPLLRSAHLSDLQTDALVSCARRYK